MNLSNARQLWLQQFNRKFNADTQVFSVTPIVSFQNVQKKYLGKSYLNLIVKLAVCIRRIY